MRQGDVTSRGRNPDRRLQRGKQAAAARAALFTRAPEDEEAGRPDGCIWCGHPATSHQWDYLPEGGDTRQMRLNVMECFDCAAELSTHQAICYVRPGLNGWRAISPGAARLNNATPAPAPSTATRESKNGGGTRPHPTAETQRRPANKPAPPAESKPKPHQQAPAEPEPPPPEPTPTSPGGTPAHQLGLWPAS